MTRAAPSAPPPPPPSFPPPPAVRDHSDVGQISVTAALAAVTPPEATSKAPPGGGR